MKKMIKQFHQTKDDYQKEKIKKNTLETMQGDIEKNSKREIFQNIVKSIKMILMCEIGYMAVLMNHWKSVSPDLERKRNCSPMTKEKN